MDHTTLTKTNRGRKMRPGRYIPGPPRIFVAYCDNCHQKVLLPVEDMKYFGLYFRRQSKSWRVRLLHVIAKSLGGEEIHRS